MNNKFRKNKFLQQTDAQHGLRFFSNYDCNIISLVDLLVINTLYKWPLFITYRSFLCYFWNLNGNSYGSFKQAWAADAGMEMLIIEVSS